MKTTIIVRDGSACISIQAESDYEKTMLGYLDRCFKQRELILHTNTANYVPDYAIQAEVREAWINIEFTPAPPTPPPQPSGPLHSIREMFESEADGKSPKRDEPPPPSAA